MQRRQCYAERSGYRGRLIVINVLVVDDHLVVREGLKRIISTSNDIAVVEEAVDGDDALQKISRNNCDVVLLDIALPGLSGLDILRRLKKNKTLSPPIIILSVFPEEQFAEMAFRSGAYGYLTKESASDELLSAIRAAYQGEKYIGKAFAGRLAFALEIGIQKLPHETLSPREYSVMCMIGSGKGPEEIAEKLSISPKTVGTYRARILEKMGMKSTAELIRYVIENQLSLYTQPGT